MSYLEPTNPWIGRFIVAVPMWLNNQGTLAPSSNSHVIYRKASTSSLQSAVRFAKRWSLSGIIFASDTLISCPRLIGYVKQSGLACGSYGLRNNIPENAKVSIILFDDHQFF
jgi:glycerophosphoryl diester phosphodiesterase